MLDLQQNPCNEILYISFNQDFTCFVCGTENGFRVYSTDPFRLTYRRDFENSGGLGVISMLFRTNILALTGGGRSPRYQPHKVVLWDDRMSRVIAELSFRSTVKSVRLRRDLVVVALEKKIYVYGFRSLTLFDTIETSSNPKGLCCLSVGVERAVLVCPGAQKGRALVVFYPRAFGESASPPERERTTIIAAHESVIATMALDYSGGLLATASDRGTLIRIFDTSSGHKQQEQHSGLHRPQQELRRGADRAEIHSLVFSPSGEWMALASDKGTVHIFAIEKRQHLPFTSISSVNSSGSAVDTPGNQKSSLQRLSKILPYNMGKTYFSSEWSLAQFRVPDFRCAATFGADPNTVIIVCANGSYYKAKFDPNRGGEMTREEFAQFDDASTEAARTNGGAPSAALAASSSAQPDMASAAASEPDAEPVEVEATPGGASASSDAAKVEGDKTASGAVDVQREQEDTVAPGDDEQPTTFVEPGAVETLAQAVASVDS